MQMGCRNWQGVGSHLHVVQVQDSTRQVALSSWFYQRHLGLSDLTGTWCYYFTLKYEEDRLLGNFPSLIPTIPETTGSSCCPVLRLLSPHPHSPPASLLQLPTGSCLADSEETCLAGAGIAGGKEEDEEIQVGFHALLFHHFPVLESSSSFSDVSG